jgi:dihydrodipicolinate synthase/N-acetylneuraminate lyase
MGEARAPAGLITSLVTPFGEDGEPDLGAYGRLIEAQVDAGAHGLFLLGTAGEGVLLPVDVRKAVLEHAVERVAGRIPILAHCGAADTATAADLARHAEAVGVVAEASVAPYFFAYGATALTAHFRTIAESAPGIAHYVYENPERVGYAVGVDTVVRLVEEVPNVLGVKDTGDSIARIGRYLARADGAIDVYAGNNELVAAAIAVGARGAVSAIASAVPELMVALVAAATDGKTEDALALQRTVIGLHACIEGLPYLGSIKHLCRTRGLPGGGMRAPQPAVSADQAAEIDRRLATMEELRPWLRRLG